MWSNGVVEETVVSLATRKKRTEDMGRRSTLSCERRCTTWVWDRERIRELWFWATAVIGWYAHSVLARPMEVDRACVWSAIKSWNGKGRQRLTNSNKRRPFVERGNKGIVSGLDWGHFILLISPLSRGQWRRVELKWELVCGCDWCVRARSLWVCEYVMVSLFGAPTW